MDISMCGRNCLDGWFCAIFMGFLWEFVNGGVHAMFLVGPRYPDDISALVWLQSIPISIGFRCAFATTYLGSVPFGGFQAALAYALPASPYNLSTIFPTWTSHSYIASQCMHGTNKVATLPETNSQFAPENGWLEYYCWWLKSCTGW